MNKVNIVKRHGRKWSKQAIKRFEEFGKTVGRKMERELGKVLKMENFRFLRGVKREGLGFKNRKQLDNHARSTAKRVAKLAIVAGRKTLDREIRHARVQNITPTNFVQKKKAA